VKAVNQTLFGKGVGNCFAACVASILEVPLESLPHFCVDYPDPWYEHFLEWCDEHGVCAMTIDTTRETEQLVLQWCAGVALPCIALGDNARGKHAVVLHRGGLCHDPNPNNGPEGLRSINFVVFLTVSGAASPLLAKLRGGADAA
jgi:hypothetical protein